MFYALERVVIINVHMLLCTTLAILSAKRNMDMPLLVVDSLIRKYLRKILGYAKKQMTIIFEL